MENNELNDVAVLVVDDSATQRLKLKTFLESKAIKTVTAEDGNAMKEALTTAVFDLVLLDVNMPGDDGFTLVTYLKANYNLGIIMVTSSDELVDRVTGLELGADDYITKPFEPRELIARIKSVRRRLHSDPIDTAGKSASELIKFGRHVLNLSAQQLYDAEGESVTLTSMEFDLLKVFADNAGRVLSREFLLDSAHKRDSDPFDRSIDIRIGRIRRKIEADPSKPQIIKTVRGSGYIFVREQKHSGQ
ncbi:MAG: response regulator [Granulosicoccus sp.]|nr:response regulator [Granulosicoccus sp.]